MTRPQNEILIKSHKMPDLIGQILYGEMSSIGENESKEKNALWIDNDIFIYEMYKILKKADELGAFDKNKEADGTTDEDGEPRQVIYV